MDVAQQLIELYGRIPPLARRAVEGLDVDTLVRPPAPGANTIAWLVWHMGRIQDDHIAAVLGEDQLWVTGDWAPQFGLDPDPHNTGFGNTPEQVAAVRPQRPEVLNEYLEAAWARTQPMLAGLSADDLDRVVDKRWNPPVTLGVRLVSIAEDGLQHAGQASYIRGLLGA